VHRYASALLPMCLQSVRPLLLAFALLISGCNSSGPPEFRTGYVFPGSENVISLDSFWFNVEGGGVSQADKITPDYDPIGGYLFLYWLDDNGNVCSGQPGVSGQPGAVYIAAFKQQAWALANTDTSIPTSQMVDFQKIPYRVSSYITSTQASGVHFVQFGNRLIRTRADGKVHRFSSDALGFSVPLIISIDTTNTLFPIHPDKQVNCSQGYSVPLPNLGRPAGQHANMCGTRALPVSSSMDYQESVKYCMINLPHGTTWWNIP
jgi:hypothetical protein